jgi:hypothetical protein
VINSATFGNPQRNSAIAYGPRSARFAFWFEF